MTEPGTLRTPMLTAAQVRQLVACPVCGAQLGQPCSGTRRRPLAPEPSNHGARTQAARDSRTP